MRFTAVESVNHSAISLISAGDQYESGRSMLSLCALRMASDLKRL